MIISMCLKTINIHSGCEINVKKMLKNDIRMRFGELGHVKKKAILRTWMM